MSIAEPLKVGLDLGCPGCVVRRHAITPVVPRSDVARRLVRLRNPPDEADVGVQRCRDERERSDGRARRASLDEPDVALAEAAALGELGLGQARRSRSAMILTAMFVGLLEHLAATCGVVRPKGEARSCPSS